MKAATPSGHSQELSAAQGAAERSSQECQAMRTRMNQLEREVFEGVEEGREGGREQGS